MKHKKSHRPPVDLDNLNLKITEVDDVEANELRGGDPVIEAPLSEVAMNMAADMKRGQKIDIRVASDRMVLTTRRLFMDEFERVVRGSNLAAHVVEEGTLLTFSYVKRT